MEMIYENEKIRGDMRRYEEMNMDCCVGNSGTLVVLSLKLNFTHLEFLHATNFVCSQQCRLR